MSKSAFKAAKSNKDGNICLRISLKPYDWDPHVNIEASAHLTTGSARELAAEIIRLADIEDAKMAKREAAEERRKKWRDREIAAGRIKVMSARDFFGRRL